MLILIIFASLFLNFAKAQDFVFPTSLGALRNPSPPITPNITNSFLRHNEINAYLDKLAQEYPLRVRVSTLTQSSENRDLKAITIHNGLLYTNPRYILVSAGLQGNERLAPAIALYIIHQLVENFRENSEFLQGYVWIIVPLVNPDGYEYSHNYEPTWQKSRRPLGEGCFGVDLDRNFDFHWGQGESPNEMSACSSCYRGPNAFSEPETRSLRDLMLSFAARTGFYLSLQSDLTSTNKNQLLYPWRFSSLQSPQNQRLLRRVAKAGADAILFSTYTEYKMEMASNVNANAGGSSTDYALGKANIPIVLTMALPKMETPSRAILPVLSEAWAGVRAMAGEVMTMYDRESIGDAKPIWFLS